MQVETNSSKIKSDQNCSAHSVLWKNRHHNFRYIMSPKKASPPVSKKINIFLCSIFYVSISICWSFFKLITFFYFLDCIYKNCIFSSISFYYFYFHSPFVHVNDYIYYSSLCIVYLIIWINSKFTHSFSLSTLFKSSFRKNDKKMFSCSAQFIIVFCRNIFVFYFIAWKD